MSGRIYDSFLGVEIKCKKCGASNVRRPTETNFNGYYCVKCDAWVDVEGTEIPITKRTQRRIDNNAKKYGNYIHIISMKDIIIKQKWNRFRFKTKSVEDYRPLIFNAKYPWWCSGYGEDCAIIIAYLPLDEDLYKYWDDAYDISSTEEDEITFTSRFPKPTYFIES